MARKKSTTSRTSTSKRSTTRGGTSSRRASGSSRKSSSRSANNKPREPLIRLSTRQKVLIGGIAVIFLTAILILSILSPDQGRLTAWLSEVVWQLFGWGGFLVPLITGALGAYLVLWGMEHPPELPLYRLLGVGLLLAVFEGFASMAAVLSDNGLNDYRQVAESGTGGGYFGGAIAAVLTGLVGNIGAVFILVIVGLIGAVLLTGITRRDLQQLWTSLRLRSSRPMAVPERDIRINPDRESRPSQTTPSQLPLPDPAQPPRPQKAEPAVAKAGKARGKGSPAPTPAVNTEQPTVVAPGTPRSRAASHIWTMPAVAAMLEAGSDQETNNAAIREQVEIIEHTLESFGAPATVVEINQGPTITQFGVEPNYLEMRNGRRTKVKVGKIASLADDLALALAARSIRIQAPVPGKSYVGIEVPNTAKAMVALRDVIETPEFGRIKTPLGLGLGQNVAGQPIVADLTAMPHLLIAGTTGSGKSVCVNGIIACLLLQNSPDDLKLVMIDPKRVELTGYNGIPHLAAPVIVDMDRVISTLQWALREMDTRYKLFAEEGARNIIGYNKKMAQHGRERMPYIVIIIDELADLMMMAPEDTERAVTRLAQMARATGIHMIIATQRPSVDVVTGLIKANFPARIAFAVASGTDSRVILDSTGAERLLGQGDMLFQSPDAAAPIRCQGCYVSELELNRLIGYWQRARRQNLITADDAIPRSQAQPAAAPAPAKEPPQTAQPMSGPPPRGAVIIDQPPDKPVRETAVNQPRPSSTTARPPERPAPPPPSPSDDVPASRPSATPSKPKEEQPVQQPLWEALQEEAEKPEYADELMPEAIALVRKLDKASTSLLQRRFRIGYTRAARMIDAMEEMGIIGPPTGTSKARDVIAGEAGDEAGPNDDNEDEDDTTAGALESESYSENADDSP